MNFFFELSTLREFSYTSNKCENDIIDVKLEIYNGIGYTSDTLLPKKAKFVFSKLEGIDPKSLFEFPY